MVKVGDRKLIEVEVTGLTGNDYSCMPLCVAHHTGNYGIHRGKKSWAERYNVDVARRNYLSLMFYLLDVFDIDPAFVWSGNGNLKDGTMQHPDSATLEDLKALQEYVEEVERG